jgi:lipopolysaccharide/colanic/teichoic acid biosynthesis glycosyltransferase
MLTSPFSYPNNVRAASFVGIGRPPAGASGGTCISLIRVRVVVVATIAIALSAPRMLCVALAIKLESPDKPGIAGRARIKRLRGERDSVKKLKQRVKHDLEYIEKIRISRNSRCGST